MSVNCEICGKYPERIFRCEEHFCCDVCGTKNNLCYQTGGLICNTCHKEFAKKQVAAFDGDTSYTSEITCPWCGDEKSNSWEACDEGAQTCDNCENEYRHIRNVEVTYSTSKIEKGDGE